MKKEYNLKSFKKELEKKNPDETLFIQAIEELATDVIPYMNNHQRYCKQNLLERLVEPDRVIMFKVPWIDDQGEYHINRGYRVQFNNALGPYKGGLRFHPSVKLDTLKFLGFEQIFKNSLTTLYLGGGKGGSDFNPKGKSDNEVMRFCQAFMRELSRYIGADTDIPAGDIGVGAREIGYLFGMYKKLTGSWEGSFTGKDLTFGGLPGRTEATGYGLIFFTKAMLEQHDLEFKNKKCLISGSGNVALYTAQKLLENNAQVLSFSDSDGSVFIKNGLTKEQLDFVIELKEVKRGRLSEFAEAFDLDYKKGKNPWSIEADYAFPCATQNELKKEDAKALTKNGIQLVAEGANMPCTPDAIEIFKKKSVIFGPAKAANAGGVATSGLEMSQNSTRIPKTKADVFEKLQEIMESIHDTCVEYGQEKNHVDYSKGANIGGFVRVADAMIRQGIV